jgi:hypothetical protein
MWKVILGALAAVVLGLGLFFFFAQETEANATPCEKDCLNDSGGLVFCVDYCKKNGSYGPPKK